MRSLSLNTRTIFIFLFLLLTATTFELNTSASKKANDVSRSTAATLPSTLPKPDALYLPVPLSGWTKNYGGSNFPDWKNRTDAGAPVISFVNDTTFPDESVAVLGDNLLGSDFLLWAEGMTFQINPLRTAKDRAQIVVPLKNGSASVPKSVMLLWPRSASGVGAPVRINGPELFWVWPGKKYTNETDRTIRLFGKNLFLPGFTPHVIIKRNTDTPVQLNLTMTTANEIRALLPLGYKSGSYSISIHNGSGGKYGWSNSSTFTVAANTYLTSTMFSVDSQWGATDQEKIVKAIAAAKANGGGTVAFGARTYTITADIAVPELAINSPAVILKGSGPGHTTLVSAPEKYIYIAGAGSGVKDMKLEGVRISVRTQDVSISNVYATANDMPLSNWEDYMAGGVHARQQINLNVTDSTFTSVNAPAAIFWASNIRFSRCKFVGRYNDGYYDQNGSKVPNNQNTDNDGINFRVTHNVIVEDSEFQSEDALNGKLLTRGIAVLNNGDSHHVYQNNKFVSIGAFPSSPNRDTNTGEVILFHGIDEGLISNVVTSDMSSVTVSRPVSEFTNFKNSAGSPTDFGTYSGGRSIEFGMLKVIVLSGRAAGQILTLKSAKSSTTTSTTLEIPRWQNISPAPGDRVLVRAVFDQHLVLNNFIDSVPNPEQVVVDFNRMGVLLWTSTHDSIIANNTIKHTAVAMMSVSQSGGLWVQGSNEFRGNSVSDLIAGGPYNLYPKCFADSNGGIVIPGSQFFGIANTFRNNYCSSGEVGVAIGAFDHDRSFYPRDDSTYVKSSDRGVMHTIIENNTFTGVTGTYERPNLGFAITTGANWSLIRNNKMDWISNIDYYRPDLVHEVLFIEQP